MVLLFGNAFGAYATAYGLTGGTLELGGVEVVGLNPSPKFTVSGGTMRARHIGLQCNFLMEGGTELPDPVYDAITQGFEKIKKMRQAGRGPAEAQAKP